jgi:hypothetical protein
MKAMSVRLLALTQRTTVVLDVFHRLLHTCPTIVEFTLLCHLYCHFLLTFVFDVGSSGGGSNPEPSELTLYVHP